MNVATAYRDLIVGAFLVILLALLLAEPLTDRRNNRRKADRSPQTPAAPVTHAQARTALDEAYAQATEQALAQAETGQGWKMPTRQQVAADLGMVRAEHDQVVLTDAEAAAFADLMKRLPMIAAGEPIDPDDAHGSKVPARWFCSAQCAAVGIALAQLKTAATPPKK